MRRRPARVDRPAPVPPPAHPSGAVPPVVPRELVPRHVAVVMMASHPSAAAITKARDAGITEFLRRPFSAAQIGEKLGAIMKAPRAFVETDSYAGPDRRRRSAGIGGDDRRAS